MTRATVSTSTLPWLAAMLLGATVHVGWLAHELTQEEPPVRVVTVPPTPQKITLTVAPRDVLEVDPPPRERGFSCGQRAEAWEGQLECTSDAECVVGREVIRRLMHEPARLAKHARVVPSMQDGSVVGFKLYGIRRGSIPMQLGFKNGDLITAINDQPLTSIDHAMQAYATLRTTNTVCLTGLRKGEPFTKEFSIQ